MTRLDLPLRGILESERTTGHFGFTYEIQAAPDSKTVLHFERDYSVKPTTGWPWLDSKLPYDWLESWPTRQQINFYDLSTRCRVATIRNEELYGFAADGRLITMSLDYKTIHFWDTPPGRPWLAIFGWAALPAGFVGVIGMWSRRRSRKAA